MLRCGLVSTVDRVPRLDECEFYHVMQLPGRPPTNGQWDLRGQVDAYLGNIEFRGSRVLEIGPASGFLTFELEQRGANVIGVEVCDEPGWDFVPYPRETMLSYLDARAAHMNAIKNSFWFAHNALGSMAQVYYGDLASLPDELGEFDVAILAAVLLHCRSPLEMIQQCAARANLIIITDVMHADLEGQPVCRLHPTAQNRSFDTWWNFSTDFFCQFLGVVGFDYQDITRHEQKYVGGSSENMVPFFTIVARRA